MNKSKKVRVHVLPAFHYDVAYRKTYKGYLPQALEAIAKGVKLLKKHKDFTFCVEQVVLFIEYWKRNKSQHKLLKKLAREGRLYFAPGMFTMPDSNIPSGENFIRNAVIGKEWLRENLGVEPDCCWMADIFGHNPQSPQLCAHTGYKSYMFERGKSGNWDTTFSWKGLDGTEIPAHWQVDTYFGIFFALLKGKDESPEWTKNYMRTEMLDPLKKYSPCKDVLMTPLGGDFLIPTEEYIQFIRDWNKTENDYELIFSTPSRYFAELEEYNINLPKRSDDMNPLLQGCWTTRIKIKQYNRKLEELAASLELAESAVGANHSASDKLWNTLTWNAFHDIICGTIVKKAVKQTYRMYEKSFDHATDKLNRKAEKILSETVDNKSKIRTKVFFNSLPYSRKEILPLENGNFTEAEIDANSFYIPKVDSQKEIPGAVKIKEGVRTIENSLVRIKLAENGTICSLKDLTANKEFALKNDGMNNLTRQVDYGDCWVPLYGKINPSILRTAPFHDPRSQSGAGIAREGMFTFCRGTDASCGTLQELKIIHAGPYQATVEFYYDALNAKTEITLRKDEKLIRFKTTLFPKGQDYRIRAVFPTGIKNGSIRHSVPFGHIEHPEGEYAAQGWMDYADEEKGLLLLNKGLPGNNVTDGVMMLSLFRAKSLGLGLPGEPWLEEDEHVFEYAIMPFNPSDKSYDPARISTMYQRDIEAVNISGKVESCGNIHKINLVELKAKGAEISCIRKQKKSLLVRLWESSGENNNVELLVNKEYKAFRHTDAEGLNGKSKNKIENGKLKLKLKPFEIVTLLFE